MATVLQVLADPLDLPLGSQSLAPQWLWPMVSGARVLCALSTQVSLVTLDLSFISVLKVMPALAAVMAPGAQMVVLIKPQFEAGRAQVGAGGLVKDPQVSTRFA